MRSQVVSSRHDHWQFLQLILFRAGVPNLVYMHPQGYICLSEGVHLRLSIEDKIYLHIIYFQLFIDISVNIAFKSQYMLILKYIHELS